MSAPAGLEAAAAKALVALLRAMGGTASWQRSDLALTLHMLEALAPRFFQAQQLRASLDAALAGLLEVPASFGPRLGADEAMARLDALYLRRIRGLKPRAFDPGMLKATVARSTQAEGLLWGWLMGELAAPLGVQARVPLTPRWPFAAWEDRTTHLYHLTHLVLIDTGYLLRPAGPALVDELLELQRALPQLIARQAWDLLAECSFCLARAGTGSDEAVVALALAQQPDGGFAERGTSARVAAHCTAAGLLALAGALDLERLGP